MVGYAFTPGTYSFLRKLCIDLLFNPNCPLLIMLHECENMHVFPILLSKHFISVQLPRDQ